MKRPAFITPDGKLRWHSNQVIDKTWIIWRLKIHLRMRAGDGAMGRLGGGWAWKLGAMGARNEIILELIFFSIRFTFMRK